MAWVSRRSLHAQKYGPRRLAADAAQRNLCHRHHNQILSRTGSSIHDLERPERRKSIARDTTQAQNRPLAIFVRRLATLRGEVAI